MTSTIFDIALQRKPFDDYKKLLSETPERQELKVDFFIRKITFCEHRGHRNINLFCIQRQKTMEHVLSEGKAARL